MTKYGIWKTRYTQNAAYVFEDWVRRNGEPVLFFTELAAYEAKHAEDMRNCDEFTEFEVRKVEVAG